MDLSQIIIFALAALTYSLLVRGNLRGWVLMVSSVFAVYWLQPFIPIRYMDYLFPTFTLLLSVAVWWIIYNGAARREDWLALGLLSLLIVGVGITRYLIPELRPTPSRPPGIVIVLLILVGAWGIFGVLNGLRRFQAGRVLIGGILTLIALFIVFKSPPLSEDLSRILRNITGESVDLASSSDIQWLGFSYVIFRLIHLLRDHQQGKLPGLSLREHLSFVLFFPAFTAGPIDRAERFADDFRALPQQTILNAERITQGGARIFIGIFKKFVLADTLALVALSESNFGQIEGTAAMWVALYLYAFRLFFDFSGYSDIAIGLGTLVGIQLPENFNRPYLRTNITAFWQSWHMTLSNWVRFYVFFPMSRAMLRWKPRPNQQLIVLSAHLSTMIIIGLWHQITLNFFIWGAWHGLGLFIHKRWSDHTRKWFRGLQGKEWQHRGWSVLGTFLTFHFVLLGWVWFNLPEFSMALDVFEQLMGLR